MLVHNTRFEELAKAPVKQSDVEVVKQNLDVYGYIDSTPYWTSSDLLMEVKIDALGDILGAVTKKATVKLLGIQSTVAINDVFQVRLGLYDEDLSAYNYVSQGFFVVDEIDYDYEAGSTTVTMYDHMWRANKLIYSESIPEDSFTYPITVEDLALEIANVLNIELMEDFHLLPNAGYEIQEDLYSQISAATIQNVIQDIAGATGTTARITDTTLTFSSFDVNSENLTSDELKKLTIGEKYGPVTSVILGRVPANDNIALFAQDPNSSLIEGVDTVNNLLTITGHGMDDGNMIYLSSDGTLPAPLESGTPYYVYTGGDEDTFALTTSYNEATQPRSYLDFDGSNDYISVDSGTDISVAGGSWSGWVKFDSFNGGTISQFSHTAGGPESLKMDIDATGKLSVYLVNAAGTGSTAIEPSTTLNTDQWYHLAYTYVDLDGTNSRVTIYVDGQVFGQTTTADIARVSTEVMLGSTGTPLDGKIKRVRFFSDELTAEEVERLYYGSVAGTDNLDVEWLLETGAGIDIYDTSGNENDTVLGTSLITNSDIENEDISEFQPYVNGGDAILPTVQRTDTEIGAGFYSLEVVGSGASTYSGVQVSLSGLTTSENYRISVRYKGTEGDNFNIYAGVTGDPQQDFIASGDWETHTFDFTASTTTPSIYFRTSADDATFYLDDVEVYQAGASWGEDRDIIDLTSSGSGSITIDPVIVREIQINNNEILDDEREVVLPPLYNELAGIEWSDVKAETIGLAWHEIGDVIQFTQDSTTVQAFISEIHLVFDGSIKESIISEIPETVAIDYKAAGGITKTLYNTEIKVDKQAQTISSIVSEQETFEGETLDNFTQVYQDIDDITLTVQKAGGGNLLLNSVGYAREAYEDPDGDPYDNLLFWDYNDNYNVSVNGTATSYTSSESQNYGGISGQVIEMQGSDMLITQRVDVAANTSLSFGLRVKNIQAQGTATITLSNDNESFTINIDDAQDYIWEEFSIVDFESTMPWLEVTIQVTNALKFMFTDLRLLYGTALTGWVQANSEILSANVQFTKDGMRIFDSVHDTETRVTYNEFSTRRKTDGEILFEADDVGVLTNNLTIKGGTNYLRGEETIIKQITIGSANPKAGLAFIKVLEIE